MQRSCAHQVLPRERLKLFLVLTSWLSSQQRLQPLSFLLLLRDAGCPAPARQQQQPCAQAQPSPLTGLPPGTRFVATVPGTSPHCHSYSGTLDTVLHHSGNAHPQWLTELPKLVAVMRAIARGVLHLHCKAILHRDLKPGKCRRGVLPVCCALP